MTVFENTENLVHTSLGPVPIPCHLRQANYLAGLFKTRAEPLEHLLQNTGHRPALKLGKSYYVAIGFIQYKDTDLGPYNEIIISIPCIERNQKPSWSSWINLLSSLQTRKVLQYVAHIYVTSPFSMVAGREIWGFPKELLSIDAKTHESDFKYEISNTEGALICRITGHLGFGFPVKSPHIVTLTKKNSKRWVTPLTVEAQSKLYFRPALQLQLGKIDHPLSDMLKKMELQNASPLLVFHSPEFKGAFDIGHPYE